MEKALLTAEEAAEMLSIGRSKVYELIASRALGSVKIGACRRVPVDAITSYLQTLAEQR